jgi:serpin B
MPALLLRVVLALLVTHGSLACAAPSSALPRPDMDVHEVAKAANAVSFAMWQFLQSQMTADHNLVLSGVSVQYTLGMLALATRDATRDEVLRGLGLPGNAEDVGRRLRLFQDALQRPPGMAPSTQEAALRAALVQADGQRPTGLVLETAHAIWLAADIRPTAAFSRAVADIFGAEVHPLDSAPGHDPAVSINQWVAHKTHGTIPWIIAPPLPTQTMLAMLNAMYFLGTWTHPFDRARTRPALFTALGGSTKDVPMMEQRGGYAYGERDDIQVLRLPYTASHVAMTVLLPKHEAGYVALRQSFDAYRWARLRDALEPGKYGQVALPRFEVSADHQLKAWLQSHGIRRVFAAQQADFRGLTSDREVALSHVVQKVGVKVDETGTEAAAVTAAILTRGIPPREAFTFRADHPFLFVIEDLSTGALLFVGAIQNP